MARSGLVFGFLVATSLPRAFANLSCSDEEQQRINSFGGGYVAGGFPRITVACTKAAIDVFSGIAEEDFGTCMSKKLNISKNCSHCWQRSGQYGFDNCKMPCLDSWCSSQCLACSAPAVPNIVACAGIAGPAPVQCDGVPGDQTGAEDAVTFLAHKIWGEPERLYSNDVHAGKLANSFPLAIFLSLAFFACFALGISGLVSVHRGWSLRSCSVQDPMVDVTEAQITITPDQRGEQYAELSQFQSSEETSQIC